MGVRVLRAPPYGKSKAMGKISEFLKAVRAELNKVSWPQRKLVTRATVSVIIFSLIIGIYLWVLDLAFTKILYAIFSLRGS